ncbi:uncharacterized protein LOC124164180 isoform X2 [Ischnura elegans]|uniref:uncharacterized protein LOC124164180 isoform X2 n=1 Tax=Ischnura elegans TaxID=197161 RepID=UPI001ED8B45F|nr:uncharacterized protein LOC124164180 isoform X2 [Ischnura elegans]
MAKRNGRRQCAALWCESASYLRLDRNISFFHFPKDPVRSEKWSRFCLRTDLLGGLEKCKNQFVCGLHFRAEDFYCLQPRPRLKSTAVPSVVEETFTLYGTQIIEEGSSSHSAVSLPASGSATQKEATLLNDLSDSEPTLLSSVGMVDEQRDSPIPETEKLMCSEPVDKHVCTPVAVAASPAAEGNASPITPMVAQLQAGLMTAPKRVSTSSCSSGRSQPTPGTAWKLLGQIAALRSKAHRLKAPRKVTCKTEVKGIIETSKKYLSPQSHMLFSVQLQLSLMKRLRKRWPAKFKDFAMSLYSHGPKAYRFLQKVLLLPSIRTLQRWQREDEVQHGLNQMKELSESTP